MINQEKFNQIEAEHGCGYYHLCWEKACPCAITTQNKGLTKEIYDNFIEENRRLAEEMEEEDY